MNYIKRLKKEFVNCPDLIIKMQKIAFFRTIYVVFLETVSSANKVNDYVLKNIIIALSNNKRIGSLQNFLAGPVTKKIDNYDQIEFYITNGFTIIIDGINIYAVETKADINRQVNTPEIQTSIYGPKDSFTENYQTNIGLIKRRIKSNNLKIDSVVMGRLSKTTIGILYIAGLTDESMVNDIKEKLLQIDIDGIIDSTEVSHILDGENKTVFPTILRLERPDVASQSLLEGKIVVVVDTSPFVLVMPSFFIDFINPSIDNYNKGNNVKFIQILRMLCFLITTLSPSLYIAFINYNQEAIPTKLLLNFAVQREGVPFPAFIEAIIMLVICELLRESDLRFPSSYGSSISILGALIIGEAAVSAGIVSPIMIIVIATTFISSLIFTDTDMVNATRHYRFLYLFAASIFGLLGITVVFFLMLIKLCDVNSLNKSYMFPITPYDKTYFKKRVFKGENAKDTKRSDYLVKDNITRKKAK